MNKKMCFLLSFALILAMAGTAKALSLGAAPGVMEIGELERGKEYAVDFYLTTNSDSELLTSFGFIESRRTMFTTNVTGRYTFIPWEASEEDMSGWLKFLREKVVVSAAKKFPVRFPDGSTVNANEKVTILIDVPEDAEPGYHTFEVVMNPTIPNTARGTGVSTIGITRPFFIFKIPGIAKRGGVIDGIAGSRGGGTAVVDVLFRNTGTVTVSAHVSSLKVYDEMGNYLSNYKGGAVKVPPKGTGILKVAWPDRDGSKQKNIRVEATVDYSTGQVTKEGMITIPRSGITAKIEEEAGEFPWWIIILLIGILMLYVYWKRR